MTTGESGASDGRDGLEDGLDELDAELRALFTDDRLDLRPRADARHDILAGAKRRRRRRAMLTGSGTTLAVIAVAAGVLSVQAVRPADPGASDRVAAPGITDSAVTVPPRVSVTTGDERLPPPAGQTTERKEAGQPAEAHPAATISPPNVPRTSEPVSTGRLTVKAPILGPDGYRTLTLGMSYRDAVATDLLMVTGETPPPEVCAKYELVEGTKAIRHVMISNALGVVGFASTSARTPEGAGVGTSVKELHKIYPDLRPEPTGYSANSGAGRYRFAVADHHVTGLQLVATESDCSS